MTRFLAPLRVAVGCLTILPLGPRGAVGEAECGGSLGWFPLVGLAIGVILAGAYQAAARLSTPLAAGAVALLAWVLVTGAVHLDGLGDCCDGLYAGTTAEERLRIMRDPHIGAMAVIGIGCVLLLKCAFVSSLPGPLAHRALLLTPCIGRCAMVLLGTTLPYARPGEGTGAAFVRGGSPRALIGATLTTFTASVACAGVTGLALLAVACGATLMLRAGFRRTLGGITGDALGAAGEVIEVLMLTGFLMTAGQA